MDFLLNLLRITISIGMILAIIYVSNIFYQKEKAYEYLRYSKEVFEVPFKNLYCGKKPSLILIVEGEEIYKRISIPKEQCDLLSRDSKIKIKKDLYNNLLFANPNYNGAASNNKFNIVFLASIAIASILFFGVFAKRKNNTPGRSPYR